MIAAVATPSRPRGVRPVAPGADLRVRYDELRAGYRDAGMHPEHADIAAWYRCGVEVEQRDGVDAYGAEAALNLAGLPLPITKQISRWSRLRDDDTGQPGTRAFKPAAGPSLPECFSWADGQPYTPPADKSPTADRNVLPRHWPPSHVTFINAWTSTYGSARVEPQNIAREIVDMLAPPREQPEPITPAGIAATIRGHFANHGMAFGLVFRVFTSDGKPNGQPIAFQITAPEGVATVRGALKPIIATDPQMQPYADRVKALADRDLAEGFPAAEGEGVETRKTHARRTAFEQVAAEFAAAEGLALGDAKRRLEHAGIY